MLDDFDILNLDSGGYELVSGRATFQVTFDEPTEKAMFDLLIARRGKSSRDIVRHLVKNFGKPATYAFFGKLKNAGLIFYDNDDRLGAGKVFEKAESMTFKLADAAARPIVIVSASDFATTLKSFDIFANAKVVDAAKLLKTGNSGSLDQLFGDADFIVVDATSYNPELLLEINRTAASLGKPWLLVQGTYERHGHVGPLFYGKDTGCYQCFRDRLRSNANAIEAFDRYERWLDEEGTFSQPAVLPSNSFNVHLAAIAAVETEKFLLDYDVPQSYGYLLSVDARNYSVNPHRLYKIPFCEVCNDNFEFRRAPWLDSVTLAAE